MASPSLPADAPASKPHHHHHQGHFVLGIDLGTTTVKVALLDDVTRAVIRVASRETAASIHSDLGSIGNEQDPQRILTALQFCLSGLPKEDLVRVRRVGVSGQMHGVVLWEQGSGWVRNTYGRFETVHTSHLFTWQDGRCTQDFLAALPAPSSHLKLASGLGCCTLLWLVRHKPEVLEGLGCAATIQDFVVAMLCSLERPVMSVHNAASWGYFDTAHKTWNTDILESLDFPVDLLPAVIAPSAVAGVTKEVWYGIPEGTPVGGALGDLQCSILSRLRDHNDAGKAVG